MAKKKFLFKDRIKYHHQRLDSNFVDRLINKNPKLFYSQGFMDYIDKVRHGDAEYDGKSRQSSLARLHGDQIANSWYFGFKNAKNAYAKYVKEKKQKARS